MSIKTNPFMPSFGRLPKVELVQTRLLTDYLEGLISLDANYQTSIVYGVRGAGKTVFMLNIKQALAEYDDWYFLRLSANQGNLLFQLLDGLQEIAGFSVNDLIQQVQGVSLNIGGIGTSVAFGRTQQLDFRRLLPAALKRLQSQAKHVLIAIDEVSATDEIRAFATEYQTLIGEEYPIALLMTGLPSQISAIQNDQTLTFLLRGKRLYLDLLPSEAVRESYHQYLQLEDAPVNPVAVDTLAQLAGDYAYNFQLMGYYAWRQLKQDGYLDEDNLQTAIDQAKEILFRNAYERICHDLSPHDKEVLLAIAKLGPGYQRVKDIRDQLDMDSNYFSIYRNRLNDALLIDTSKYGYLRLILPLFDEYLLKQ